MFKINTLINQINYSNSIQKLDYPISHYVINWTCFLTNDRVCFDI